jgi:TIR domain
LANARVFVSYSWDNEQHRAWVRELCARLVTDGIQVRLDQWYVRPGDSFLRFMEDEIRLADVVVVVCTPTYAMKANARRGGAGFEGQIISNAIFRGIAKKCIPVIVSGTIESGPTCAVPTFLEGIVAIFFSGVDDEVSYEELLRSILGKPRFFAPPLGTSPKLLSDADLLWGSRGGQRVAAELDYSSPLALDFSAVANSIDAIQTLGNPSTWRDFEDSKPEGLWMKSESNALTSTLYAIWAPMVDFELERVSRERRFAGFDWRAKLQVLLMAAIANAYQDDDTLSCIQPGLPYSPRVAGWRTKREREPAKFWWQGLCSRNELIYSVRGVMV